MVKTRKTSKTKSNSLWWVWKLIISIIIPLAVGGLSALIAGDLMASFGAMNQPPLSPPAWLFPVAWTVLYTLMGIACYLVWNHPTDKKITKKEKTVFYSVYGLQLVFNFFWSIFFFNFSQYWFAFVWLIILWIMILVLVIWGGKNYRAVMWCLTPYVLWVTFAGYLNIMIAILN